MATARKLSLMFVVAVLVASICFADVAQGIVLGRTLRETKMQEQAGTGQFLWTKLRAKSFIYVDCRLESSVIGLDPWWLHATSPDTGKSGYVADFDVECQRHSRGSLRQCSSLLNSHHRRYFIHGSYVEMT